jgi:hypothetical protein
MSYSRASCCLCFVNCSCSFACSRRLSCLPAICQARNYCESYYYCHNKHPFASGFDHTYRNHCARFHYYIDVGTCHLNRFSELCLGPKPPGDDATRLAILEGYNKSRCSSQSTYRWYGMGRRRGKAYSESGGLWALSLVQSLGLGEA